MAGGGLLALLDDITLILDDVAAMSKIAAKKTAGIVGDDLAVNANALIGIEPSREIPIVAKVAAGSLVNKAVLIPLALALPTAAITPLLMVGGAFLCYEAVHKMTHKKDASDEEHHQKMLEAIIKSPEDLKKVENKRIWQAIGTDTVLSAEIIAVALATFATAPLMTKALALSVIGFGMTVGVYGLVAGLVKLDDAGLHLQKAEGDGVFSKFKRGLGAGLVNHTPKLMKGLSIVGTAAMFLVGGGILVHGIPALHHGIEAAAHAVSSIPLAGGVLSMAATGLAGIVAGFVASPVFKGLEKGFDAVKKSLGQHFVKLSKKNRAENIPVTTPAAVPQKSPVALAEPGTLTPDMNAAAKPAIQIEKAPDGGPLPQKKIQP